MPWAICKVPLAQFLNYGYAGNLHHQETSMYYYAILILLLAAPAGYAQAQGDTCSAQAQAKNLHGAAATSFLTRCKSDCVQAAEDKKIYGAARTSFVTRCQS